MRKKVDRTEEMLKKSERINKDDIRKFSWITKNNNLKDIVFDLEPSDKLKENKHIGDEIFCYLCNGRVPRGISIVARGKMPNNKNGHGEMQEFSFRQYLCSDDCGKKFEEKFFAFTKNGMFTYDIAKVFYKILEKSNRYEASIHDAVPVLKKQDKGYICKGCRKQKSLLVPYFNVVAKNKAEETDRYWKDKQSTRRYQCLAGRVCSKECYDLYLMKVI